LGVLFKFLLFFLGAIYLLRLLSPFLFRILFSSLAKKASQNHTPPQAQKSPPKKKNVSDSIGEYIDYEEVE
jgi:hypothetical protein